MTNSPTPKASQEHRCVEFGIGSKKQPWILVCACEESVERPFGSGLQAVVNAFTEHVLDAFRDEAPTKACAADENNALCTPRSSGTDSTPDGGAQESGTTPAFSEAQRERAALISQLHGWHKTMSKSENGFVLSHWDRTILVEVLGRALAALKEKP